MSVARVLVTGSRHFSDAAAVRRELVAFPPGTVVIHGAAAGADALADAVARECGFNVIAVPADWKTHGRSAGPRRNQRMLDDYAPTIVVAFPLAGSRGTWDMVRRAREAGIPVRIIDEGQTASD